MRFSRISSYFKCFLYIPWVVLWFSLGGFLLVWPLDIYGLNQVYLINIYFVETLIYSLSLSSFRRPYSILKLEISYFLLLQSIYNPPEHTKAMFGSQKVQRKEKKMIRKMIFSYLVVLWKISKKIKYN